MSRVYGGFWEYRSAKEGFCSFMIMQCLATITPPIFGKDILRVLEMERTSSIDHSAVASW
jgi:hypothetical protein